jgi:sRNA-binding protein
VRRQGRLLAAFSLGGEVLLAGPGDTAADVTVLDVSEDGVRVRLKDGSEELLRVP